MGQLGFFIVGSLVLVCSTVLCMCLDITDAAEEPMFFWALGTLGGMATVIFFIMGLDKA